MGGRVTRIPCPPVAHVPSGTTAKTERNQESAPSELVGEGRGRRDTPKPLTPWDLYTALSTESCTLNNHPGLILCAWLAAGDARAAGSLFKIVTVTTQVMSPSPLSGESPVSSQCTPVSVPSPQAPACSPHPFSAVRGWLPPCSSKNSGSL